MKAKHDAVAERLKKFAKDLKSNSLTGYRVTTVCRACGRLCDFAIDCGEANAKCIAQCLNAIPQEAGRTLREITKADFQEVLQEVQSAIMTENVNLKKRVDSLEAEATVHSAHRDILGTLLEHKNNDLHKKIKALEEETVELKRQRDIAVRQAIL